MHTAYPCILYIHSSHTIDFFFLISKFINTDTEKINPWTFEINEQPWANHPIWSKQVAGSRKPVKLKESSSLATRVHPNGVNLKTLIHLQPHYHTGMQSNRNIWTSWLWVLDSHTTTMTQQVVHYLNFLLYTKGFCQGQDGVFALQKEIWWMT